jgi:hypothetical protein
MEQMRKAMESSYTDNSAQFNLVFEQFQKLRNSPLREKMKMNMGWNDDMFDTWLWRSISTYKTKGLEKTTPKNMSLDPFKSTIE